MQAYIFSTREPKVEYKVTAIFRKTHYTIFAHLSDAKNSIFFYQSSSMYLFHHTACIAYREHYRSRKHSAIDFPAFAKKVSPVDILSSRLSEIAEAGKRSLPTRTLAALPTSLHSSTYPLHVGNESARRLFFLISRSAVLSADGG